ncbi:MAG: glycosyltransferase family 2 protein [Acidimicrobiales bacterium]|nr:glycosyltransferase family 2 protein [Acidimicrobiales bacterium]
METPAPSRPAAPAVVAVMVTRNPGPWFDEALDALAAQDYTNLAVLVVDAASDEDPAGRVASVLPDAFVLRLDDNPGFGAAANKVREVVDGAAFYCFFHDDVAPKPRAITTMVGEALRSNAGIVGGKLVRWDDDRRLLQVGVSADKTGERSTLVEPGELDQEQHDAVRDVFLVPGGATLVRSDLFDAIGGFDEGIDLLNDDLNLCWRAHVAGGRVVVAPDAVIRHLEVLAERSPLDERRVRIMRHRIRTMLVCYGRWHRIRVVPQAVFVAVLELVYSVLVGRGSQARDVVAAWRWNLARRGEIRRWRARVEEFRTVPDAEIRRLQLRGSARVVRFFRGQSGRGGSRSDRAGETLRRLVDGTRDGSLRWPIAAWAVTIAIVTFGSRHLLFGPIAVVGGFLPFDQSPGDLFSAYLSGWRDVGLGAETPAPTSFGLLGGAGTLFLGAMGALRRVVLLGSLAVGLVGAFRLLRPTRSVTAQAAALVVYGAAPLAYDAIAGAQWGALTVYAATPWMLGHLAHAGRFEPFGDERRGFAGRVCGFGLLLALAAAIEPAIVVVTVAVAVGLALGTLLAGGRRGLAGLAATTGAGLAITIVLHLPWAFEFILPGATWEMVVGAHSAPAWSVADLLRFDVGPVGSSVLLAGLPLAALLPLLIGRDWRFDWAVRAWSVAITLVLITWAAAQGWLPLAAPRAETMLMPVAMSLGVAVAMGVVAFQIDLRQYGFGWRQVAAAAAGLALLIGAVPTLLDSGDGRWYLPSGGLDSAFAFLEDEEPGFRTLWVGDPDVMPVPGYPLGDDVTYATTDDGLPALTDGWPGAPPGSTQLIEDSLGIARSGETSRLGRLLAPMAIRYIVVPTASAPQPLGGERRPAPEGVLDALSAQLDLAEVAVNPAYVVYRNEAALPARSIVPPDTGGGTIFDVSADELAVVRPALDQTGRTRFEGEIEAGSRVLHSATAGDGWELQVDGRSAPKTTLFGWADGYDTETGGSAVLRYDTSPVRYALVGVQFLFWLLVAVRWFRSARFVGPLLEDVPLIEENRT